MDEDIGSVKYFNKDLELTKGYYYEVDLEYPFNLQDKIKYFPFCPEKIKVNRNMLSTYQLSLKDNNIFTEKLILNPHDKKKYIIEGSMLDWYLDHGMKLKNITRVSDRNS